MAFASRAALLAALGVILLAPPAGALTLIEAVDRAIARSPEMAGFSSQIEVQQARQEIVGRAALPQVGVDGSVGGQFSNLLGRGPATQARRDLGARVTQRLWDWQRTGNAIEAASRRTDVSALDLDLARDRVAFLTSEAYLNTLRQQGLLKLTQENIAYHRWLVDVGRERVAKNQLAKVRLAELKTRLAPLVVEKIDHEAERDRAATTLTELVGTASDLVMPRELPTDLRPDADTDTMVANALKDHPALKRTAFLIDAAGKGVDSARAAYWPAIDANLSSRYMEDAEGIRGLQWDNQALVRMNWSLFGEGVPAQIREAEASRRVAEAQQAQARMEITIDVRRYATTLQAIADKDRVLQEYRQIAKFSMEAGMAYIKRTARFATDMMALSDLINVRYHAEANLLANRYDRQLAELRLIQAAGRLMPTLQKVYRPPAGPASSAPAPTPSAASPKNRHK